MLVLHGIVQAKGMGLRFDFDGITTNERARFMVNFGGNVELRHDRRALFLPPQRVSSCKADPERKRQLAHVPALTVFLVAWCTWCVCSQYIEMLYYKCCCTLGVGIMAPGVLLS